MIWLVEAKVKIITLIQSVTHPEFNPMPGIKESPETPLELAIASNRNIVGVIQHALDSTHRRSKISLEMNST